MRSTVNPAQQSIRVRRLSRLLAATCLLLIALLPLAVAVYWRVATPDVLALRANLPPDAVVGTLLTWQRIAGGLLTEIPLLLLLLGLWNARRCFLLFAAGEVFTTRTVGCLRRFAGWTAASVVAGILADTAVSIVITLNNPLALRHLAISIGSDQILLLFFAGMVWLMAGVIGQGQALAEENATFV